MGISNLLAFIYISYDSDSELTRDNKHVVAVSRVSYYSKMLVTIRAEPHDQWPSIDKMGIVL